MQRVRRDSASSTDSWSIIEQRCSPEVRELFTEDEHSDLETDSDVEIGEEVFDSHDSDIEVDNQSEQDEVDSEQDEEENEDDLSEDEEEVREEPAVQKDWGVVSQREAMSGEGKHFVAPERIRSRLDSFNYKKEARNRKLFLKSSLGCFVAQNVILLGLLLFSRPVSDPCDHPVSPSSPWTSLVFLPCNASSLQCCWSKTPLRVRLQGSVILPTTARTPLPSWSNITAPTKEYLSFPSITKVIRPTVYGTTISKRSRENTCLRVDQPRFVPKSLFPCNQMSAQPTLPEKYNLSALENIIRKRKVFIEDLWERKMIDIEILEIPQVMEVREFFKMPKQQPKRVVVPKAEVKPRGRSFNYKLEVTPVKKCKSKRHSQVVTRVQPPKSPWSKKHPLRPVSQPKHLKITLSTPYKAMMVYDSRKKMAKYSSKNRHQMSNSSYSTRQCQKRDFRGKKLQLEDKSHRRRQRLLEYKIDKPCRAVYKKVSPRKTTESKKKEKTFYKTKKNETFRRQKKPSFY